MVGVVRRQHVRAAGCGPRASLRATYPRFKLERDWSKEPCKASLHAALSREVDQRKGAWSCVDDVGGLQRRPMSPFSILSALQSRHGGRPFADSIMDVLFANNDLAGERRCFLVTFCHRTKSYPLAKTAEALNKANSAAKKLRHQPLTSAP